jgi:hypothetical protein
MASKAIWRVAAAVGRTGRLSGSRACENAASGLRARAAKVAGMHRLSIVQGRTAAGALGLLIVLATSGCGTGAVEVPETPVTVPLAEAFALRTADGEEAPVDDRDLPVVPGTLEARWYAADGRYVLLLAGESMDASRGLCVQAWSAAISAYFPTAEGTCDSAPEEQLLGGNTAVRQCGPLAFFLTDIPAEPGRELAASVVRFRGDVMIFVGGFIEQVRETAPSLDLDGRAYALPAGVVSAEPAVVKC